MSVAAEESLYLAALAAGLAAETAGGAGRHPELEGVHLAAKRLGERLARTAMVSDLADWQEDWKSYRILLHRQAAALNDLSSIARAYASIEEFWADARAEERGESSETFWDIYENGHRRQIEQQLAAAYGSPAALLVNCGMSALTVALGAAELRPGSLLVTGVKSYFETTELLETLLKPAGIRSLQVPLHEPRALLSALRQYSPAVVLLESVTNGPEVLAPVDYSDWHEPSSHTLFIVDNSVQSHLCRWFALAPRLAPRLLVAESAAKYLTHECMAGVLYGPAGYIEKARRIARTTGQQLQLRALAYLAISEAQCAAQRLALHSRNTRQFVAELIAATPSPFDYVRPLDGAAPGNAIFEQGVGALVFVRLRSDAGDGSLDDEAAAHRRLLSRWQANCHAAGIRLMVRAGFGWNETVARVYESQTLNRSDAPTYLRIAVGIEPEYVVRALARALLAAGHTAMTPQECHASAG